MTVDSATDLPAPTDDVLRQLASSQRLFIASDFDGVLAPIVSDPLAVRPLDASLDALRGLAASADTLVAVVSGRERRFLRQLIPHHQDFVLVGSHGAEVGQDAPLDDAERQSLVDLTSELNLLSARHDGLWVETKALSTAIHFRRVDPSTRQEAIGAVDTLAERWPGKLVKGKEVLEFTVATATKGDAVQALRHQHQASAVVVLGDDVTDEDAFSVLGSSDAGIKVGPGPTAASYRVSSPEAVSTLLQQLMRYRLELLA